MPPDSCLCSMFLYGSFFFDVKVFYANFQFPFIDHGVLNRASLSKLSKFSSGAITCFALVERATWNKCHAGALTLLLVPASTTPTKSSFILQLLL